MHVLFAVPGGFLDEISIFFYELGVDSDPVVDSRPALRGDFHVIAPWRGVHGRCFDCKFITLTIWTLCL